MQDSTDSQKHSTEMKSCKYACGRAEREHMLKYTTTTLEAFIYITVDDVTQSAVDLLSIELSASKSKPESSILNIPMHAKISNAMNCLFFLCITIMPWFLPVRIACLELIYVACT